MSVRALLTQIFARLQLCIFDNLLSDLVKVVELLTRKVEEFAPFIRIFVRVTVSSTVRLRSSRSIDKLENLAGLSRVNIFENLRKWSRILTRGRRVTMPVPRGRKSRPTMFSKTELLPLDWEPITVICGKSTGLCTPTVKNAS